MRGRASYLPAVEEPSLGVEEDVVVLSAASILGEGTDVDVLVRLVVQTEPELLPVDAVRYVQREDILVLDRDDHATVGVPGISSRV